MELRRSHRFRVRASPRRTGRPPRQRAACYAAFAPKERARPPESFFIEATTGFTCIAAR
jgi:hypothetical protein